MVKLKKNTKKLLKKLIIPILLITIITLLVILLKTETIPNQLFQKCGNTCATDYNQRPTPHCGCYSDKDNDGIPDSIDPDPLVPTPEDEAPLDSDGDGWYDEEEEFFGTDPLNPDSIPTFGELTGDELCESISGGYDSWEHGITESGLCSDTSNAYCESLGKHLLQSSFTLDYECCAWECGADLPVAPEERFCTDSDGDLTFVNEIRSRGICIDNNNNFNDGCFSDTQVIEYGCDYQNPDIDYKVCMSPVYDCVEHLGEGAVCNAGRCEFAPEPTAYTNSECYDLKISNDRLYHKIVDDQADCDNYVFLFCDSIGMTGWLTNFEPTNCCTFDCKNL